jgi:hypothetical protein
LTIYLSRATCGRTEGIAQSSAAHEAGHAVAASVFGIRLIEVRIATIGENDGECVVESDFLDKASDSVRCAFPDRPRGDAQDFARFLMAGIAAEIASSAEEPPPNADLGRYLGTAERDLRLTAEICGAAQLDWDKVVDTAVALVYGSWGAIRAVGDKLLETLRLPPEDVTAIIRANGSRPAPPRTGESTAQILRDVVRLYKNRPVFDRTERESQAAQRAAAEPGHFSQRGKCA